MKLANFSWHAIGRGAFAFVDACPDMAEINADKRDVTGCRVSLVVVIDRRFTRGYFGLCGRVEQFFRACTAKAFFFSGRYSQVLIMAYEANSHFTVR